jgi:hypothetical protein
MGENGCSRKWLPKSRDIGYKCPLLWSNQLESSDLGTLQMDFLTASFTLTVLILSSVEKIKNSTYVFVVFLRSTWGKIHALNSLI